MENNEYVIVSKTAIQKRIEELFTEAKKLLEEDGLEWQDEFLNYKDFSPNFEEYSDNSKYFYIIMGKIESLQDYLYQSTPLIPELERKKSRRIRTKIKTIMTYLQIKCIDENWLDAEYQHVTEVANETDYKKGYLSALNKVKQHLTSATPILEKAFNTGWKNCQYPLSSDNFKQFLNTEVNI